jgi:hypothetical protein
VKGVGVETDVGEPVLYSSMFVILWSPFGHDWQPARLGHPKYVVFVEWYFSLVVIAITAIIINITPTTNAIIIFMTFGLIDVPIAVE